jgi:translation initiation factor 1 (eIF-1/SUI1)
MKNLKKQEEFSQILDLEKIDIAKLSDEIMSDLNGGGTINNTCIAIGTYYNNCRICEVQ